MNSLPSWELNIDQLKKPKKISSLEVAIITQNRSKYLTKALISLTKQTVTPKRIIIIDNASKDNTKEVICSFEQFLPIKYLYEPNIGIPYARNLALESSQEEILAFLDDDCETSSDWLENMVKAHKQYANITVIQGRSVSIPRESLFSIIAEFNRQLWIKNYLISGHKNYPKTFELTVLDTKNVSMKVDQIRRLHLKFEENFVRGSDTEFAKRLLSKNQHILFYPKAIVFHKERDNLGKFLIQSYLREKLLDKLKLNGLMNTEYPIRRSISWTKA